VSDPETIYRERWCLCECGKERQVGVRDRPEIVDDLLDLFAHSPCGACTDDIHRRLDMCSESVGVDRGISMCTLPYAHTGRCEPQPPIPEDVLRKLRDAR
jgi:hypothetical protein